MEPLTKDQLIQRARAGVREISPGALQERLESKAPLLVVDVREADELGSGKLRGAVHIPRGLLELRIEGIERDRAREVVVYCAAGARSALAARALGEMGYTAVSSLSGGFGAWKDAGLPWVVEPTLTADQKSRYARHLLLPEVGEAGQLALLRARVLLIGAGGLGSPVALYLAAAGVGTLGVVDADTVDASNLQRQILHRSGDIGVLKVDSAERAIRDLNADVKVRRYAERFTAANALRILDDGWDVVVDGCDNFPTRYVVNDACVFRGIPNVHGSIYRFEGQASVFDVSRGGPCYRCLYPEPPPPGAAPSCAEAGVIGALPGLIGTVQATETIKLVLGRGRTLSGRLLQLDALEMTWRELKLRRDPRCPVCGDQPTITELVDYGAFCGVG